MAAESNEEGMRWMADQADGWLRDARNAWKECARLQAMARDAREMADGLRSVRYDVVGRGPGMAHGDDGIVERISRFEAIEERYRDALIDACDKRTEAWETIDAVSDVTGRLLLQCYYIDCMTWEQSAERVGYSYQYAVQVIRVRALAEVYELMPDSARERIPAAI